MGLTREEFETARRHGAYCVLIIAENAAGEGPIRLHVIRDPASQVDEYRLDDAWKAVALGELRSGIQT